MTKYIKSGLACKAANVEQHKLNSYINNGDYPCARECEGNGKTRLFSLDVDAPALRLFGDLIQTHTVRHAGQIAASFKKAMEEHPAAPQLTRVTLANGSTFVRPTSNLDTASGWTSGGFISTAMIVDVRNLRDRVQLAVEADAAIIGSGDED